MTKIYATLLGLLIGGSTVTAQRALAPVQKDKSTTERRQAVATAPARGASIWCSDFSQDSDWTAGTLNGSTFNWEIGTDGPAGAFAIADIVSSTATNGFALYDSDLYCEADDAYLQMASPVSLLGVNNVVLTFEQYYRRFQGFCFVDVSNNGTTWTTYPVNVNNNLGVNMSTTNPSFVSIDISPTAGNQATVWVRFRYVGNCDYAWMVDDVCISQQVAYDADMVDGYMSHTGDGLEYGTIAVSQFYENMLVGARFTNNGANPLTNVVATIEVRNSSNTVVGTTSTTLAELASGDTVVFEDELSTAPFEPTGLYNVSMSITSNEIDLDEVTDNNVYNRAFRVSNTRYGLDGVGVHPAGTEAIFSLGTSSFATSQDNMYCMAYYDVPNALDVYGIEVLLAQSSIGGFAIGSVHDTTDVFANPTDMGSPLSESAPMDLVQSDLNNGFLRLMFPNVTTLAPGAYYAAAVLFSNGGTGHIRILDDQTVIQPGYGSLVFYNNSLSGNGEALAVRLITEPISIGIGENGTLEGISFYPNPSDGIVNIRSTKQEVYELRVFSVTGELVRSERINGTQSVDLSDLAKGIYTLNLSNNEGSTAQRLTLY
jgi:hypothetical protein